MLDLLDKKLIKLMQDDAQQSSEVLAKQLEVSPATIRRRVRRLIKSSVMRIAAVVDPAKVGLPLAALIALDVAPDKLDPAMQMLSNLQDVRWVSLTTGRFDVIALVRFPSTEELSSFVQNEIAKIEGVRNSETFVCLHMGKMHFVANL